MKLTNDTIDSLCFDKSINVCRAKEAMNLSIHNFMFEILLLKWVCGFDANTGDVLFFIPTNSFRKYGKRKMGLFLTDLKNNWGNAGFEIIEERLLPSGEHPRVDFPSIFYRLKCPNS